MNNASSGSASWTSSRRRRLARVRRSDRPAGNVLGAGTLRFTPDETRVTGRDGPIALTPRELHVLHRLLKNAGRVVTKAQLTEALAARNDDIGDNTVEVYVHRIRQKIQGNEVEIVTVRGFGYLLQVNRAETRSGEGD